MRKKGVMKIRLRRNSPNSDLACQKLVSTARKTHVAQIENNSDPRRQASPLSPLTVIRLERERGGSIEVWAKKVTLVSSGTF